MSPRKDSRSGVGRWGRAAVSALLLWLAVAQPAWAITLRDIVELSKAGVSDAVIVELIESDGSVFRLSPDDVLDLKAQGVSDRVVLALLRTWQAERARIWAAEEAAITAPAEPREQAAAPAPAATQTVIIQPPLQIFPVPVPVPSRLLDRGRIERRTSDRVDGLTVPQVGASGHGQDRDRRENRAPWIVNSAGWIVR